MSARYIPTEEQAFNSPTCHALAAQGATEREAIEHLFQQNQRLLAHLASLAAFQPIGPIVSGGKVYTNPTAEALAAEGHARELAKMLDDERRAGAAVEREACARIADAHDIIDSVGAVTAHEIAEQIRERGTR